MINFDQIAKLEWGESSSLGGFSNIMDILQGLESGLVLETFTGHKENVMSTVISLTNKNYLLYK